jgi:cell envelope opacity-associated protein A
MGHLDRHTVAAQRNEQAMSTEQQQRKPAAKYQVISVEKADPPEGMEGKNWHRYVIGQGQSRIQGFRTGTLKAVTKHAEEYAKELNERGVNGYSAYVTRKKQ